MTIREVYLVRGLVEYEGDAYNVPCLDRSEVRELLERLEKAGSTADSTEVEHWRWEDGQGEIVKLYRINWTTLALVPVKQFMDYGRGCVHDRHETPWRWKAHESFDDSWHRQLHEKRERGEV